MAECPRCKTQLVGQPSKQGLQFICPGCNGRAISIDALRKADVDSLFLTSIWEKAHNPAGRRYRPCPHCGRPMAAVDEHLSNHLLCLDICSFCHALWFDTNELGKLPSKPVLKPEKPLSEKAKKTLLDVELEMNREIYMQDGEEPSSPLRHFLWVLGLAPIEVDESSGKIPFLTWGLATFMVVFTISLILIMKEDIWKLGYLPSGWRSMIGLTILTSLFFHVRILQLIINIIFLSAVGNSLEESLGWKKMLTLFFISHCAGLILYSILFPNITTPYFGASAAIAGLLAYKAVINPRARYSLFPPIAGHYFNMRWHKMVINSQMLLAIYCVARLFSTVRWYYSDANWRSDHWLYISIMMLGGILVGIFAGIWHRATENENRIPVKPVTSVKISK